MLGANAYTDIFLVVLLVAGIVILLNGLIDIGFGAVRRRYDSLTNRLGRTSLRRKAGATILPPPS